jgi:hypothetical protein
MRDPPLATDLASARALAGSGVSRLGRQPTRASADSGVSRLGSIICSVSRGTLAEILPNGLERSGSFLAGGTTPERDPKSFIER